MEHSLKCPCNEDKNSVEIEQKNEPEIDQKMLENGLLIISSILGELEKVEKVEDLHNIIDSKRYIISCMILFFKKDIKALKAFIKEKKEKQEKEKKEKEEKPIPHLFQEKIEKDSVLSKTRKRKKENFFPLQGESLNLLRGNYSPPTISAPPPIKQFVEKWNAGCQNKITKLTGERARKLRIRVLEKEFVERFDEIVKKVAESDFLSGRKVTEGHENWYASFDWIIKNDTNYVRILEGRYDNKKATQFKSWRL